MRIRWTPKAADDLADIVDYIRKDNPAARLAAWLETIYRSMAGLRKISEYPAGSRPWRRTHTS